MIGARTGMPTMHDDSLPRCDWAGRGTSAAMREYHDHEWGRPCRDDRALFELLVLEGAQAGLSWRTVLAKRARYRAAFHGFDLARCAAMGEEELATLATDPGLVRNRAKLASVRTNARAALALVAEAGSLAAFLWRFVDGRPIRNHWRTAAEVPASAPHSAALAAALRRRGFRFVGPTICYAFMQASGMVDDHLVGCFRHGAG